MMMCMRVYVRVRVRVRVHVRVRVRVRVRSKLIASVIHTIQFCWYVDNNVNILITMPEFSNIKIVRWFSKYCSCVELSLF